MNKTKFVTKSKWTSKNRTKSKSYRVKVHHEVVPQLDMYGKIINDEYQNSFHTPKKHYYEDRINSMCFSYFTSTIVFIFFLFIVLTCI